IMKTLSHLRCNFTGLFSSGPQIIQGDLFIISNQVTLGISEEEIIDSLSKIGMELLNYENNAREKLYSIKKYEVEDEIFRSLGILQNARSISFDEFIRNLSMVRLGCSMDIIKINCKILNSLLVLLQHQHILNNYPGLVNIDEENQKRAEILRASLKL
ncbi:MAG TPA: ATP--guanido phosphotransferase, partial [Firmicutes bacterium]|nr:ATP--guanido phosphotransferase [Bacillota bacterium]